MKINKIVLIFSSDTRLLGKSSHKITVSGLYFTKNRPETHFLRDFMIIWLSVELAGRAKIWGSHPQFRSSTPFFSTEHISKTNISLNSPFPGFTLLENDQKRTFYVILWDYMGPLEIKTFAAKKFFPNFKQTVLSQLFDSEETQNRSWKPQLYLMQLNRH